jgi:hypothetical protein
VKSGRNHEASGQPASDRLVFFASLDWSWSIAACNVIISGVTEFTVRLGRGVEPRSLARSCLQWWRVRVTRRVHTRFACCSGCVHATQPQHPHPTVRAKCVTVHQGLLRSSFAGWYPPSSLKRINITGQDTADDQAVRMHTQGGGHGAVDEHQAVVRTISLFPESTNTGGQNCVCVFRPPCA